MGIFSRKERVPDPQVTILLDDFCRGALLPGAQISGSVAIASPVPRPIHAVEVVFAGRASTHCTRHINGPNNQRRIIRYHDEVELLRLSQNLLGDSSVDPANSPTCPFSFICPDRTNTSTGPSPYTGGYTNSNAYEVSSHGLPPTVSHSHGDDHYAVVQYAVQVVVHFADTQDPFLSAPQPLVICPRQSGPQGPLAECIMLAEKYASSRLVGQEKSFMGSFKDKFSSETPSVNIVLKARSPTIVSSGTSFPIQTCVELDALSMPSIDVASVDIRIAEVKLVAVTFFRALKQATYSGDRRPEHEVVDEDKILLNASPGNIPVPKQEVQQEKSSMKLVYPASFEARIPGSTCPSFRTFNINRTYRLKMKMEADVCGKTFDYKFEIDLIVRSGAI